MLERLELFQGKRRDWWVGIAAGMIPVVVFWVWIGNLSSSAAGTLGTIGGVLYFILVVSAIVVLVMSRERLRPLGYALLTMVFVGPIIWAVGCTVIIFHK